MKKFALIVAIILVASAVNPVSAKTLGEEQKGLISTSCSSLKLQLKRIQKSDARNRVHLGAQYESNDESQSSPRQKQYGERRDCRAADDFYV